MSVADEKRHLRERIWDLMCTSGIARFPFPLIDRIPNFVGAETAAARLVALREWERAAVVAINPDYAQFPVRFAALMAGKTVVMASPRLRAGFRVLTPQAVRGKERVAASIRGALALGTQVAEPPCADLKVVGSVAVDWQGRRLGKGGGYGDREVALLRRQNPNLPVITTVHDCQVVESVPTEPHDARVDIIVTPTRVVRVTGD